MPNNIRISNHQFQTELSQLTPAAQTYIKELQQDSQMLSTIFMPDERSKHQVSQLLGTSLILYLGDQDTGVRKDFLERIDSLQLFYFNLHEAMIYCANRFGEH